MTLIRQTQSWPWDVSKDPQVKAQEFEYSIEIAFLMFRIFCKWNLISYWRKLFQFNLGWSLNIYIYVCMYKWVDFENINELILKT